MMRELVIILIIIAIVVLSQQPFFALYGQQIYYKIKGVGELAWKKAYDAFQKYIMGKVSSEIDKRQEIIKDELKDQTKAVGQNIWERIKGYFVGMYTGLFNKQTQ